METESEEIRQRRKGFFLPGPTLLFMFSDAITVTVLTDLIVYRTCLASLNMSHAECNVLHSDAGSEKALRLGSQIQPGASMIIMVKSLMDSVIPAVLSLFFGPWSDQGGRRPLLLAGFTGHTLMYIMLSLLSNYNVNPWYLIIPSIPACTMGGVCVINVAMTCYISDTTEEKSRTMLLAWLHASALAGIISGKFAGPVIYNNWGYTAVFTTASICSALSLLFTYFCVPETVNDTSKESILGLFKMSFLRKLVISSLMKRNGFHRSVVWLSISVLTVHLMLVQGVISIEYLFTRERLGWDVQQYSYISGAAVVLTMIGVLCGVFLFSRVLGFSDTLLACISLSSCSGCMLTNSFAKEAWHIYLASCIGVFGGITVTVVRSIISKSVPPQHIGKVFSLTASLETLSPLAGAPLFTLIYSHYLPPIYPSPVFLVAAGFYAALIIFIICIEVLIRRARNSDYIVLSQDDW